MHVCFGTRYTGRCAAVHAARERSSRGSNGVRRATSHAVGLAVGPQRRLPEEKKIDIKNMSSDFISLMLYDGTFFRPCIL